MKIDTRQLLILAQRYGVTISDLAEMLCVYPEHIRGLLRESVIELDEEQATNLVRWFGARDALAMMERKQRRTIIAIAMA